MVMPKKLANATNQILSPLFLWKPVAKHLSAHPWPCSCGGPRAVRSVEVNGDCGSLLGLTLSPSLHAPAPSLANTWHAQGGMEELNYWHVKPGSCLVIFHTCLCLLPPFIFFLTSSAYFFPTLYSVCVRALPHCHHGIWKHLSQMGLRHPLVPRKLNRFYFLCQLNPLIEASLCCLYLSSIEMRARIDYVCPRCGHGKPRLALHIHCTCRSWLNLSHEISKRTEVQKG